jgi:ubiquinol-cytochrome c reductase iron-sulfur subunit
MAEAIDRGRRQLLTVATTVTGAVGVAFAAVPFLASWKPSARAKALGAPVEIDISKLEPGAMLKIEWRGKPVWVVRRTPEMIERLAANEALLADPKSQRSKQPEYAQNDARAVNAEYFVVLGVCTHLGCAPMSRFDPGDAELTTSHAGDWPGGFYCPCHGSKFDLSGRVFRGVPAPTNLEVPPYTFADTGHIVIGLDQARDA